jgi:hypothetical protein
MGWETFYKILKYPLVSILWYIILINFVIHETNGKTNATDFGSPFYSAMWYLLPIILNIYFASKFLQAYFKSDKSDKSLKATCIIHCIGVVIIVIITALNYYTTIRL